MIESPERQSSDSSVGRLKEELNIERHEWPSKRDFYTICGKLGEGATGNVSRRDGLFQ
jgi:serine/threonine protein kinase